MRVPCRTRPNRGPQQPQQQPQQAPGQAQKVDLDELEDKPESYLGKTVTVEGEVDRILGPHQTSPVLSPLGL